MTTNYLSDLQAVGDVIDWVGEESDSFDAETAILVAEHLAGLARKIATVRSLCEAQARKRLDGQPIRVGNSIYHERQTGKWRPNQAAIRSKVVAVAVADTDTGEIREPREAARVAAELMAALYVSPSTEPKRGGLARIGAELRDVAEWERTGVELKATPLTEAPE